jgi:hypothetical protein
VAERPAVLVVAWQGFTARYLLRTDVARRLTGHARLVVLAPNADEPYLRDEVAALGGVVEPLAVSPELFTRGRARWLTHHLRTYTLAHGAESRALRERWTRFHADVGARNRPLAAALGALVAALWRSRALRRALLAAERRVFADDPHAAVWDRHRPAAVLVGSLGYRFADAVVMREAQRRGVPVIAAVAAWDNPTSKGYKAGDPEVAAVWSQRMGDQLERFHDVPAERVLVSGAAAFDHLRREGALEPREAHLRARGLDPQRKVVLFAASSPGTYAHNLDVARALAEAVAADALGTPASLVVRLHPNHAKPGYGESLAQWRALADAHEHVVLNVPPVVSSVMAADLHPSDMTAFGSLMAASDVLVNVFSTTTLEAFLVDRPVVLVAQTGHLPADDAARAGVEHERRWEDYEHQLGVIRSRAVRVAGSAPELLEHVRTYLADPSLEREARAEVVARELGPADGRAGERIADAVVRVLQGA